MFLICSMLSSFTAEWIVTTFSANSRFLQSSNAFTILFCTDKMISKGNSIFECYIVKVEWKIITIPFYITFTLKILCLCSMYSFFYLLIYFWLNFIIRIIEKTLNYIYNVFRKRAMRFVSCMLLAPLNVKCNFV